MASFNDVIGDIKDGVPDNVASLSLGRGDIKDFPILTIKSGENERNSG